MEKERTNEGQPWRRILVAVDHPDHAAVKAAIALAAGTGAVLGFVTVIEVTAISMYPEAYIVSDDPLEPLRENARGILAQCMALVPSGIAAETLLREGIISKEIAAAARDWNADALVLGTHRRGPIGRLLLGSTCAGVIPKTRCPILLITDEPAARTNRQHETSAFAAQ